MSPDDVRAPIERTPIPIRAAETQFSPEATVGYIDRIDGTRVSGWAWNRARPDQPLGIEIRIDGRLATVVMADRVRLKQVLLNLLSNGIKYNRQGGQLTVCWQVEAEQIRLGVKDTGEGIAPERVGRLFSPFDRLGAEHSGIQGTGPHGRGFRRGN